MNKCIFFVCDHLKGGGAERANIDLANEFLNRGYEIYFFLLDASEIKMEIPIGINIIDLNLKFNNSLFRKSGKKINIEIKRLLNEYEFYKNPSLIIISYAYAYWLSNLFVSENVWLWVHGEITYFNVRERVKGNKFKFLSLINEYRRVFLEKRCFKEIFENKKIIVINQDLYDFYLNNTNPKDIRLIYNGISQKKGLSILDADKVYDAIYVGRLSEEKQIDTVIRAFHDSVIKGKLAIVGDGEIKDEMVDLCAELGIQKRVDFIGWVKNAEEYINKSKMLILCSKTEGYGLVISEALILGVPVVAYRTSDGVAFQLSSNQLKKGLVEFNNYRQLVEKINDIYKNPYLITSADKERLLLSNRFPDFEKLVNVK